MPIFNVLFFVAWAAYEIYCDFYDCAIDPVGTYYSWRSDFSELDSDMVDTLEVLFDIAGFEKNTGIQNAAAQTADIVHVLCELVREGFTFVLFAIGAIAVFYFASKIILTLSEKK